MRFVQRSNANISGDFKMNFNLNGVVYIKRILVACMVSVLVTACGGGTDNGTGLSLTGNATLTSISISAVSSSVGVGHSTSFTATGTYSDSTTADITSKVTWASYYTSYATISSAGVATGVAAGTAYIYASMSGVNSSYYSLTVAGITGSQMGGARQGVALSLTGGLSKLGATFYNSPWGITTDGTNLFVADTFDCVIRRIVISTGVETVLAGVIGNGTCSSSTDGTGTSATFDYPTGITTDGTYVYVIDFSSSKIRKVLISTGEVTSYSGTFPMSSSYGLTTDGTYLYATNSGSTSILKITISSGSYSTITSASLNSPYGITTDGTYLYVANSGGSNILKMTTAGLSVTPLTPTGINAPHGITTDGTYLYLANTSSTNILKTTLAGVLVSTYSSSSTPEAVTTNGKYVYILESGTTGIYELY